MRVKVTEADPAYFKINLSQLHCLNCPAILGRTCPDHTRAKRLPIVLPRQFLFSFWTTGSESPVTLPWGRVCSSTSCLSQGALQEPSPAPHSITFNSLHCQLPATVSTPGAPRSAQRAPSTLCVAWLGGEAEEPALCSSVSGCGQGQG